jgi:hypothetical protein
MLTKVRSIKLFSKKYSKKTQFDPITEFFIEKVEAIYKEKEVSTLVNLTPGTKFTAI